MSRASICVRRNGLVYRLAWFNESKAGIYYGHLGADVDHHQSYHTDGNRHSRSGDERYGAFTHPPIPSFKGAAQIGSSTVWLTPVWLKPDTVYAANATSEIVVTVNGDDPGGAELYFAADWYLVSEDARATWEGILTGLNEMFPTAIDRAHADIPLENHRDHFVAIAARTWPRD